MKKKLVSGHLPRDTPRLLIFEQIVLNWFLIFHNVRKADRLFVLYSQEDLIGSDFKCPFRIKMFYT